MTSTDHPSCYLIGGDSLLVECARVLQEKNFEIKGIVSRDPDTASWARQQEIAFIGLDDQYEETLSRSHFDYLFSIAHLELIAEGVLALPAKMSVNFHDAPLPDYAGLNCPVWAIYDEATEYGITWHKIEAGVDRGDILLQQLFEIAPRETALSLNTKCFAAAIESFPRLVDSLLQDTYTLEPQTFENRRYFSRFERPGSAGILNWEIPASQIDALTRCLDFGDYANQMGLSKMLVDDSIYYPKSVYVSEAGDGAKAAGSITAITEGELSIATASGVVVIDRIYDANNAPISVSELVKRHHLAEGTQLPILSQSILQEIEECHQQRTQSEAFWVAQLSDLSPVELPYLQRENQQSTEVDSVFRSVEGDDATTPVASRSTAFASFVILLNKLTGMEKLDLHVADPTLLVKNPDLSQLINAACLVSVEVSETVAEINKESSDAFERGLKHGSWFKDIAYRYPALSDRSELSKQAVVPVGFAVEEVAGSFAGLEGASLTLVWSADGQVRVVFDGGKIDEAKIGQFIAQYHRVASVVAADNVASSASLCSLSILDHAERQMLLTDWNATAKEDDPLACVHRQFERQVAATRSEIALVFEGESLTYEELDSRANILANDLMAQGVKPDALVGVYVERSVELMVATLGVLKAGGAYVPLDPAFPIDRLQYMVEDSNLSMIVCDDIVDINALSTKAPKLNIKEVLANAPQLDNVALADDSGVLGHQLAYVIYTSGSTGKPKGVMVEHRNVTNFFNGMDAVISHDPPGAWMAVTSLSFDISVLELFWTLARGFKVVIFRDRGKENIAGAAVSRAIAAQPMAFGLFMWGNDDAPGKEKYRLMLEGAKFFDENKFDSIWTPERHFHAFGGPYPNSAVTSAAIATITENIHIRAGSCVSPLHHPVRIAEDWAVVDNLSNGRVGLSFASGWQPNDFVIKPENHKNNKQIMLEQIETVRKLWRGESVAFENPMGDMVDTVTLPRPVQSELPVWVTTAGNPETYKQAGALGANVLTHLLGQTLDELAEKIRLYREARKEAGYDPATGKVSLMLHTFVGGDNDTVKDLVREPMKDYLRSSMKLVVDFAWSFPAFKRPTNEPAGSAADVDIGALTTEQKETILDFAFERYFENSGLFGSVSTCVDMINACKQADINEIACLLDYGVETNAIMESLPFLKEVRDLTNQSTPLANVAQGDSSDGAYDFLSQLNEHKITHLQCTPSMARMLVASEEERQALCNVPNLMVGGEAFPPGLAEELSVGRSGGLTNMYGPTETTIWSTTHALNQVDGSVPIGKPIANTEIYILDKHLQPVSVGVAGQLYIGGKGVVRGYLNRSELTDERFLKNPFSDDADSRIYWTGDLARYAQDGTIEFIGRIDHQIKVRGYRIELGEIEARLTEIKGVTEAAAVLREYAPGDMRIAAYCVSSDGVIDAAKIKANLKKKLPEYMIPGDIVSIDKLPLTPNGKIDRNALPAPGQSGSSKKEDFVAPEEGIQQKLAELWQNVLRVEKVGVKDNFFDLGGHSLLIVHLHSEIKKITEKPISLTDLYQFPTIQALVNHIESDDSSQALKKSANRGQKRREMMRKRRKA